MGFELNPYDPCVANATIRNKQCTIVCYVDDNKISHQDPNVVTDVIQRIGRETLREDVGDVQQRARLPRHEDCV